MSLCTECFKKGNHHRHDFNMFLSQAGGACDCGDASVMKETGYVIIKIKHLWFNCCKIKVFDILSNHYKCSQIENFLNINNNAILIYSFCDKHGPKAAVNKSAAPSDLMCVAEAMMPKIILRLIQHLRENW